MKELVLTQLKESIFDGGWHGPSLVDVIRGIDVVTALSRPLEDRHSIWEIVQHVIYWIDRVNDVLNGLEHPPMGDPEDWKPVSGESGTWDCIEKEIVETYERLMNSLLGKEEEMLDEKVPNTDFTYLWMLFGLIHHNLYHAGQIALLKQKE
jgi:hypothetical protein